jgi:hypothetical protein
MNSPAPVPSDVLYEDKAGLREVLQQTPLEVISALPSFVTFPPAVADVCVISVTLEVVTTGIAGFGLQEE